MSMNIDDILKFDCLKKAEEMVGKGEEANLLGIIFHTINSNIKIDLLKSLNDSYYGISFNDFLNLVNDNKSIFNFEVAYQNNFIHENNTEKEIIFCCVEKAIFMYVNSYKEHLNNCHLYMQIKDSKDTEKILDGSFKYEDDDILLSFDGREALFYSLIKYDMVCKYCVPLEHNMFLCFQNYNEKQTKEDVTYNKINKMNEKYRKLIKYENLCKR